MILKGIYKKARKLGISLLENSKEFGSKRFNTEKNNLKKKWRSDYGVQNIEKNKFRYLYGIKEKQLRKMFEKSKKEGKNIANELFFMAESRIDNVIFRSGIAKTRRAARQLVSHNFFVLKRGNGKEDKKIKSPSYKMRIGDEIFPKDKKKAFIIKENISNEREKIKNDFDHLYIDREKFSVRYEKKPNLDILNKNIQIPRIIEWYNKKT